MIYFLCIMTAMAFVVCTWAAVCGKHELSTRLSWLTIVFFCLTTFYSMVTTPAGNCFYF